MLNRLFIIASVVGSSWLAASAESSVIVVNSGSDNEKVFEIGSLSRVNFVAEGLEFVNADASSFTMPFSEIVSLHFDKRSAVDDVVSPESSFRAVVSSARTSLLLYGLEDAVPVDIYNVNGLRVVAIAACADGAVDISALAPGMYIVRAGDNVQKFVK